MAFREAEAKHPIEIIGKTLRASMPFLDPSPSKKSPKRGKTNTVQLERPPATNSWREAVLLGENEFEFRQVPRSCRLACLLLSPFSLEPFRQKHLQQRLIRHIAFVGENLQIFDHRHWHRTEIVLSVGLRFGNFARFAFDQSRNLVESAPSPRDDQNRTPRLRS